MAQVTKLSRATKCRGCGREIAFIKTVNGKSIPVDPEPLEFIPEAADEKFVLMDGTVERGGYSYEDDLSGALSLLSIQRGGVYCRDGSIETAADGRLIAI